MASCTAEGQWRRKENSILWDLHWQSITVYVILFPWHGEVEQCYWQFTRCPTQWRLRDMLKGSQRLRQKKGWTRSYSVLSGQLNYFVVLNFWRMWVMLHTFLGVFVYLKAPFCQVSLKPPFFDCFQVDDNTKGIVKYFIADKRVFYYWSLCELESASE